MQVFCNQSFDCNATEEVKRRIMNAGYAENTLRNYSCAWGSFERWCVAFKRQSIPATAQDCIDHMAWCIADGFRLETVDLRLKAITHYHRIAQLPTPVDASVRLFLRNAKRSLCEKPQGKDALSADQLRRISLAFRTRATLSDVRDRALILLCFACGWRRSEIVSLDLNDVKWTDLGLILRLGKSKTDQTGRGRSVGIHFGTRQISCPIHALGAWLEMRGAWDGPLFVRLAANAHLTPHRLAADGVRRAVKRGLELVGEDARMFGAHSLRSGMITAAAEAGATETAIMARTGHRCYATLRRYIRPAEVFRANPLAGVL